MISSGQASLQALKMINNFKDTIEQKREQLKKEGWTEEDISFGLSPSEHIMQNLKLEVEEYENIKQGNFDRTITFSNIGTRLIQFRIYKGISQAELAKRLGVSPAQICRDERNEYVGVTFEKAKRILNALDIKDIFHL